MRERALGVGKGLWLWEERRGEEQSRRSDLRGKGVLVKGESSAEDSMRQRAPRR